MFRLTFLLVMIAAPLLPQVGPRRAVVRASGEGIISVRPDQVRVNISVTTGAATAQEAAETNAADTSKVMGALRAALGATAEIRTLGYSLGQRYNNTTRQYDGYNATNSIEVTISDISLAGKAIDTAAGTGVNTVSIGGIRFTIKDSAPVRMQALRQATGQARQNAEAIASGLGRSLGAVMVAQEGSSVTVTPIDVRLTAGAGAVAAPTPVEPGNVDVRATVAIEAEMN
jgi:uncharacterized protein YggE